MKRDIKYIIKKVIIGVLLFLAINFIKSNVFAVSYDRYGDKVVSNFSFVPTSSNWFDSQFIYDMFNDVNQVYNTNYDILDYPYIVASNMETDYYRFYFSKSPIQVTSSQFKWSSATNTERLTISVDLRNATPSNRYFNFTHAYAFTSATDNSNGNNANNIAGTTDNSYPFTLTKIIDINSVLAKPYISIDYLDSSYNSIYYIDCFDNTIDYCTLNINSSSGSYIKVTYNLEELTGDPIDFLPNSTYQLKTKIIGSNLDTRVLYVNPWFYWGGSTSNIDSDLLFAFDKLISYSDDDFNYTYSFTMDDEYNSYYVYEISVFFKTNSSSYTSISVPFDLSLNNISSGDIPVIEPNEPDTNIDKQDIIIDQNSQMINNQNETNEKLDEINNTLNNDNVNGANGKGAEFFNDFNNNNHGLSGIITIPLNLITSITSTQCQTLSLTLPFVNQSFNLPCMTTIYQQHFSSFLSVYQTITFGIVAYWIAVQIYALVKGFKDPENDKIEVVDL